MIQLELGKWIGEALRLYGRVIHGNALLTLNSRDAFAGGFVAGIVEGKPLEQSIDQGHWLASLSIKELGPQYASTSILQFVLLFHAHLPADHFTDDFVHLHFLLFPSANNIYFSQDFPFPNKPIKRDPSRRELAWNRRSVFNNSGFQQLKAPGLVHDTKIMN